MEERKYLASINYVETNEKLITQYFCNTNKNEVFETTDSIEFNNNYQIKIQRIGKTILTGSENWFYDVETKTYYYYQFNKFCKEITGYYDKMLCTHFRWVKHSNKLNWGEFQGDIDNKIMFKFDKENTEHGNITNFKQWLKEQYEKGKPVEVYYILQYPEISFKSFDYIPNPHFKPYHQEIITNNDIKPQISSTYLIQFDNLIK